MVGEPDDALPQGSLGGVFSRLAGLLVRDVEHGFEGLAERLGVRPAGQRLGDAVQAGDMTAGVGRDHRIADAGERDP